MEGTTAFQPPASIQRLSTIFNEVVTGHTVARKNSFARSWVIGVRCTWPAGDTDADTPPSDDEGSAELHAPSMQAAATTAPKPLIVPRALRKTLIAYPPDQRSVLLPKTGGPVEAHSASVRVLLLLLQYVASAGDLKVLDLPPRQLIVVDVSDQPVETPPVEGRGGRSRTR